MECSLCDPSLGPIIAEGIHWRLVLNHNQDLLGKCFLVSRRHVEDVSNLTEDEWLELHQQLIHITRALARGFHPDHINYTFLQNQDRHVHLHVIPRYAEARMFEEAMFDDPGYPGHYEINGTPHRLAADKEATLALLLAQLAGQTQGDG